MAEEFQGVVCGGSWWTSPRTTFDHSSCSSVIADMENFGHLWPRDLMYMKSKSSDDSSDDSMVTPTISPDSAFKMMATAFSNSSATTNNDWNQNLLLEHDGSTVDQQQSLNFATNSSDCTSYGYPSSLLQSYYISNSPSQKQPLYDFQSNSNNLNCLQPLSTSVSPKPVPTNFQLTNNTPFWNASTPPLDDNLSSLFSSTSSQSYKEKGHLPNLTRKPNHQDVLDLDSTTRKGSAEVQFKRPRFETPSPLPTFKVRKEKLGDRITALQQLVSPFGKTDTASVLHEAIEYIKLLHDQVNILSAPYMKNGTTRQLQQIHNNEKDVEEDTHDLRSLGLCLMPVSSTFPVATEMTNAFWTPSFEGSFR